MVRLTITLAGQAELTKYVMGTGFNRDESLDTLFKKVWGAKNYKKKKSEKVYIHTWKSLNKEGIGFIKGSLMFVSHEEYRLSVDTKDDVEITGSF
jgi:spore coat polysaccharide biosynthesis protein SpsF (cytidylyltransferase family)